MKATDLRKLAEAATPGPWKHYYARALRGGFDGNPVNEVQSDEHCPIVNWGGFDDSDRTNKGHKANAAFIAAANPTAVLALLDEIETLRAKVKSCEMDLALCKAHNAVVFKSEGVWIATMLTKDIVAQGPTADTAIERLGAAVKHEAENPDQFAAIEASPVVRLFRISYAKTKP